MSDSTRSVLHEVMEQQTLSIAKAGIICQLNARTSVLAAANPVESKWNPGHSILENVQLPHTLLSRFDLIFLMLDPQDELFDRRLASHLISLYKGPPPAATADNDDDDNGIVIEPTVMQQRDAIELDLLRDYIQYARRNVRPRISELARERMIDAYVKMRQIGKSRGVPSAYPRQLESLVRLAEAHARMRLSEVADETDVDEAYRLYREALKQSAMDPTTGRIDISILTTGMSSEARRVRDELRDRIGEFLGRQYAGAAFVPYRRLFDDYTNDLQQQQQQQHPQGAPAGAAGPPPPPCGYVRHDVFNEALRALQDKGVVELRGNEIRLTGGAGLWGGR